MENKYNAGLMSQSFWFVEFKKIVFLYYNGTNCDEIKRLCIEENLFGAVSPNREKRMCGYLLTRLKSMDERLIKLFVSSDVSTQKMINLITVMNTNRLFFEFVYDVYRNKLIIGDSSIGLKDANIFFIQKEAQNEELASWKESTKKKLRSLFLNFLTEANFIKRVDDTKQKRIINRVFITMELESYMKSTNMNLYKAIAGVN
jgi:hypothetical protein